MRLKVGRQIIKYHRRQGGFLVNDTSFFRMGCLHRSIYNSSGLGRSFHPFFVGPLKPIHQKGRAGVIVIKDWF